MKRLPVVLALLAACSSSNPSTVPTPSGGGYDVVIENGRVVDGTDLVDKIKDVNTGTSGFHQDVPKEDVIIERAEVTA